MVYSGIVLWDAANHQYRTLVENGCEYFVFFKEFADNVSLKTVKTDLRAELWDVTLVYMEQCTDNLDLRIGQAQFKIQPHIVNWISYDIFVAKRWLTDINPIIDWTRNRNACQAETPNTDSGHRASK